MRDLLNLLVGVLAATFKPRARLEAENVVLRQPLNVLRRTAPKRPKLTNIDRLIFVWLYRWFSKIPPALTVVPVANLIRAGMARLNQ